jgi:hypothetical protein
MNIYVCTLGMALVLGFAGIASAQDETTEQVDWEDAATYAELMDEFVSDDDVAMETYYDEAQNVLWSQPAAEPVEAAAEVFAQGAEYAATLDFFQWIVPVVLWLCDNNESSDANCASGTNYKWAEGDFHLLGTAGNTATYAADSQNCTYSSIDRIRVRGSSNYVDYCDDDFLGYYSTTEGPWQGDPAYDSCGQTWYGTSWYELDDSPNINNRTYYTSLSEANVARFRFYVYKSVYYSVIQIRNCIE